MLASHVKMWNRMIALLVQQAQPSQALQTFWQMQAQGVDPTEVTFACLFKACADLGDVRQGQCIHLQFYERKSKGNMVVSNSMLHMYAKCGDLNAADHLFMAMHSTNLVTWNSLIAGYVQQGYPAKAFEFLHQMHAEGIHPDEITYSSILKACSSQETLEGGQLVHLYIIKQGYEHNRFLANMLIDLYSKCGFIEDAFQVFHELPGRDVISWTSIITGHADIAVSLFQQMLCEGVQPNKCTFVSMLNGCASLKNLEVGKRLHIQVKERDYEQDNTVSSILIHMYAESGSMQRAKQVFEMVPKGKLIPWTTIISASIMSGDQEFAGQLCGRMWKEDIEPDASAFVSILKAWAALNSFISIKITHSHVIESNLDSNIFVVSTLVDAYGKCGSIEDAALVFDRLKNRDATSWAVMIACYAQHSQNEKALVLFWQMQTECIEPTKPSFLAAMNACVDQASVEEGRLIYYLLIIGNLESDVSIRNTLIEFCAKIGDIEDAWLLFDTMVERNTVSWTVILRGYAQQGHAKEALRLLQQMQLEGVEPDGITFIGVLSACSHEGLLDSGFYHFNLMIRYHGIIPSEEHYSCMVDLLARAGYVEEVIDFINKVPMEPSAVLWRSLFKCM